MTHIEAKGTVKVITGTCNRLETLFRLSDDEDDASTINTNNVRNINKVIMFDFVDTEVHVGSQVCPQLEQLFLFIQTSLVDGISQQSCLSYRFDM